MLSNINIATCLTNKLNEIGKEYDEEFKIHNGAGHVEGEDCRKINGLLNQVGDNYVNSKMNYININGQYEVEMVVSVMSGFSRGEDVTKIVNKVINELNGVPIKIAEGRAIFSFRTPKSGELDVRAEEGNSIVIRFNFSIEYSENSADISYEMALIDNHFCGSINTRYFESQEEQHEWYLDKINNGGIAFTKTFTPNINSLVITKQTYINELGLDINTILSKNYAIIRSLNKDGEPLYYYYYEVQNADIGANNQSVFDLKLDTLQTYYFDSNIKFSDCFISKADINRWVDNGDGTVSFDTRAESELFEREDIQDITKRLVSREVFKINNLRYNAVEANEWLDKNVLGWYYLFLSSNSRYKVGEYSLPYITNDDGSKVFNSDGIKLKSLSYQSKETEGDLTIEFLQETSLFNTMVCVAFPAMKTNKKIKFKTNDNELVFDKKGLENFIKNIGADYIYTMKFSQLNPIKYSNTEIDSDGNLILKGIDHISKFVASDNTDDNTDDNTEYQYTSMVDEVLGELGDYWEVEGISCYSELNSTLLTTTNYGMLNIRSQVNINSTMSYTIDTQFTFKKSEIVGAEHNIKFNPKLLSSDYCGLVLSDNLQNGAEYDILKLGKKDLQITYTEALTPDITKKYIRFSNLEGYYISEVADNLTGYVVSDDSSFTLESLPYQTMLANNKNFFLQNSINRMSGFTNLITGGIGTIASIGLNGGSGLLSGVVGMATNYVNASVNNEISKINEKLTVDNLKNAPNSIDGAKGNVIFNAMYSDMGVVVEKHEILPNEKIIVDNHIEMYGMTINKVKNIKDYDNMRRYHNYIEANLESISGVSISNSIREDLKQRFVQGVRFWNKNNNNDFEINYGKENYEKWLEI